jgi:hypothetical protein
MRASARLDILRKLHKLRVKFRRLGAKKRPKPPRLYEKIGNTHWRVKYAPNRDIRWKENPT